jgi:hypothetical protein
MNQYRRHMTETLGTDRPVHSIQENVRFYSTPIPEQSDLFHTLYSRSDGPHISIDPAATTNITLSARNQTSDCLVTDTK